MDLKDVRNSVPLTKATRRALDGSKEAAKIDLLLLESWEVNKPMHLGLMLRIRQIRMANPELAANIAAELAAQRENTGLRSSEMQAAPH